MSTALTCPQCQTAMTEENFGGALVNVCGECRGIWFDDSELERLDHERKGAGPALAAALRHELESPRGPAHGPLGCPHCAVAMDVRPHELESEVDIDECPECGGIFLEGGELARLRARRLTRVELRAYQKRLRRRTDRRVARELRERRGATASIGMFIWSLT